MITLTQINDFAGNWAPEIEAIIPSLRSVNDSCMAKKFNGGSLFSRFCRLLNQSCHLTGSMPDTVTAHDADCTVAEMEEEVQALERKLFLEKIAINVTDERCVFLDRNFK